MTPPATATAPVRTGRPTTRPTRPQRGDEGAGRRHRPDLRVVDDRRTELAAQRLRLVRGRTVALATTALFAALFAVAILQTVLVQGQLRLDQLRADVAQRQVTATEMRAELATLEAPDRITDAALASGMERSTATFTRTPLGSVSPEAAPSLPDELAAAGVPAP